MLLDKEVARVGTMRPINLVDSVPELLSYPETPRY